jgi:hypothetical protein
MGQHKSKCDSNRVSKKNSPNNTITGGTQGKTSLIMREARTKPTSPERSYVLVQSVKLPTSKKSSQLQ